MSSSTARTTRAPRNAAVSWEGVRCSAGPHDTSVGGEPRADRAGSLTPPSVAPEHEIQLMLAAAVPLLIRRVRFWRTDATGVPALGTPASHAPMSVRPFVYVTIEPSPLPSGTARRP